MIVTRDPSLMLGGLVVCGLIIAAYGLHESYKFVLWPRADAVVDKVETTCLYILKSSGRGGLASEIGCEARSEAAALVANGYKFRGEVQRVVVAYEKAPGRQVFSRAMRWPDGAGTARIGAGIRIRYSPLAPDAVEPAGTTRGLITLGAGLAAAIGGYIARRRRRREAHDRQV